MVAMMQALDVYRVPLQGLRLIEASAGTGKTWTIAALYLRLLLETGLDVEEILVLTFTKAATAELRTRIRERISEVRQALLKGHSDDEFCCWVLASWQHDKDAAIKCLEAARRGMDQAAIFTIHGFCQRALAELQVPALLNEPEIIPDEFRLIPGLVNEAWIRHCSSPLLATLLAGSELAPATLIDDIAVMLRKPYAHVAGRNETSEAALLAQWNVLQQSWQQEKQAILDDILGADGLSRAKDAYKELDDMLGVLAAGMEAGAGRGVNTWLRMLTPACFSSSAKKKGRLPAHAFWQSMQVFWQGADDLLALFRRNIASDVQVRLIEEKNREGQVSYQDLLLMLNEKVQDQAIATALRARFPAALIDEFQDTDPLQFGIFSAVYAGADSPAFLVGDPKQAIYSFRGADIFTYLSARRLAREQYTLGSNRRSVPGLVAAVNSLFSAHDNAFLLPDLNYQKVAAAANLDVFSTQDDLQAMVCWLLPDNEGKPISKEMAGELCVAACTGEIARLLNAGTAGLAGTEKEPLAPRDIAVLVATHRQGRLIRDALAARGVAAVLRAQESVFASAEAVAMLRVLEAVADPGNDGLLKAALLSDFVGKSLHDIAALEHDDAAWATLTEPLLNLRELWHEHGFMAMWEGLLEHFNVFARLLAGEEGERRLTNLRHLAVLMQEKADTEPSVLRQLAWLRASLSDPDGAEEALLRLESDAERVQILTVHVSKGLEFPVVFCPFLWDGALLQKHEGRRAEYHADNATTLDFGSENFSTALAAMSAERLAEKLRLLYVALTRAKYRCYTCWGPVKDMETAALSWLLLGRGVDATPQALKAALKGSNAAACRDALQHMASVENGMCWQEIPANDAIFKAPPRHKGRLAVLQAQRPVQRLWAVSSFSGLTAAAHEQETPDHDAAVVPEATTEIVQEPLQGIHAFPRGAQAGVFWHELLETRLGGQPVDAQIIVDALHKYELDAEWAPLVERQLNVFLNSVLDDDGLCLGRLDGAIVEMEFTYPVQALSPRQLQRLAQLPEVPPAYRAALASLDFRQLDGFLKGFIDLICRHQGRYYVIDYKTNWLGADAKAYTPAAMQQSVAESHYYLQYWLYTLALHRYLRSSMPGYDYEKHIAGVRYLYLRGIDGNGTFGVYSSRPSRQLIDRLDAIMEGRV
jgi:exodeoxyribonuclease V beta subunit